VTRPKVILIVGLPGSGKSTYAKQQRWPVLASDEIRRILLDDARDQSANRSIFALLRHMLRKRLELRRPVTCIDATNLTSYERRPYIKTAQLYGADIEAVYLDVPIEICHARNLNRDRVVPPDVVERMSKRLQPPSLEEGFSTVRVLRTP
jgi:predicted kinase